MVEILNDTNADINLSEYSLSDKEDDMNKYRFPSKVLKSGEYMLVYCSGNVGISNQASFKISAGETIYLSKNGELCDSIAIPEDLGKNESYGYAGSVIGYLKAPTPLGPNAYENKLRNKIPTGSVKSGVYGSALTVSLSSDYAIRYTTDGSRPTASSKLYTGPINVTKTTSIRAACCYGNDVGEDARFTYVIDKTRTLPVMNIAISSEHLSAIRRDLTKTDGNVEYEVLATYIENGVVKWMEPCGLHLHGKDSRYLPKQNFTLKFRSTYGVGKLHYKMFDDLELDSYDAFILNGGSEDYDRACLRDALCGSIVYGKTYATVTDMKPIVLYIGGDFWGIYYVREKFDEKYVASHYSVSEESVTVLDAEVLYNGKFNADYDALCRYVKQHDMKTDAALNYVSNKVDINSYIDYYLLKTFFSDNDIYNVKIFKTSEGDNKWRRVFFDLDWAQTTPRKNEGTFTYYMENINDVVFLGLIKNEKVRKMILTRYDELTKTALAHSNILNKINEFESFMKPEIADDRKVYGLSVSTWQSYMRELKNYFVDDARARVLRADIVSYFQKHFGN